MIFQIDSLKIREVYETNANCLIEYDHSATGENCAIYFSSNNIYFPNDEAVFTHKIIEKNSYEWFGTRLPNVKKHIFLRDIKKQWYLSGINSAISTPELLLDFLKKETSGYDILTIGSSAGGYAALLYGSQLKAKMMYSFNGQMELHSLLKTSNPFTDPLIFEFSNNSNFTAYYDLINSINRPENVYYFYSNKSDWDARQRKHIQDTGICPFEFNTAHHGIPFLKQNLPTVLNLSTAELKKLVFKVNYPIIFSIQLEGLFKTIQYLSSIIFQKLVKA